MYYNVKVFITEIIMVRKNESITIDADDAIMAQEVSEEELRRIAEETNHPIDEIEKHIQRQQEEAREKLRTRNLK